MENVLDVVMGLTIVLEPTKIIAMLLLLFLYLRNRI